MPKKFISRFFLSLGIVFFIGIFISPEFRRELGNLVSPFLDPLAKIMPIYEVILILSVVTASYSTIIQKFTVDTNRLKEMQKKMAKFQKEYMEAMKQDNKFKLKQLESEREEINKIQSEMMGMQMKPMFYTMVVTLPIFMWLYAKVKVENILINVPFAAEKIHIGDPVLFFPWWIFWYLLCSIVVGQVIRKVLRM
ncbi:putative membrane protein [Archaeoglobus sulfaticallidus PM70-1]|uniref:Putative membrane protein n=1 Tax=Archaeoglobus sulfaticallidus PM70-1 TaxID=387631 RepID=N0BJ06_9EURY|nr:EMC3/TMCO1 family protein [Archaeoglobus sulfaticallidus]AGK60140.1 putative membrane protein [Archaeoglobus sulfaticallidus PM70-1]